MHFSGSVLKAVKMIKRNCCQTNTKPFTILVEGNIASGKSTFLGHFKNNSNVLTLKEPVEQWQNVGGHNLFDLMYNDCNNWSFTFQSYAMLTMLKLHEVSTQTPVKVMERSVYSTRYCFVENLYNEKLLTEPGKVVLDEWFKWIAARPSVACDLIVYLRTDPEVVYERMKKRQRKEEENVQLEYLQKLHHYHEDWLYNKTAFSCPAPVLVLDANKSPERLKQDYINWEQQFGLQTDLGSRLAKTIM